MQKTCVPPPACQIWRHSSMTSHGVPGAKRKSLTAEKKRTHPTTWYPTILDIPVFCNDSASLWFLNRWISFLRCKSTSHLLREGFFNSSFPLFLWLSLCANGASHKHTEEMSKMCHAWHFQDTKIALEEVAICGSFSWVNKNIFSQNEGTSLIFPSSTSFCSPRNVIESESFKLWIPYSLQCCVSLLGKERSNRPSLSSHEIRGRWFIRIHPRIPFWGFWVVRIPFRTTGYQ